MIKKYVLVGVLSFALCIAGSGTAFAATNSENSPWNNSTLNSELGFTCTTNPTLEDLGTSFATNAYMMDATTTSVEVAVIPAMQSGNCKYLLPLGDFTLDYIEVKLFEDYSSLNSEVLETYEINPDDTMKLTITGLDAGEDYYIRYRPMFLNTETDEYYSSSARTATLHTLFPMSKRFYNVSMASDGTASVKMKSTNPAYANRDSAKVRMLLLDSKRKRGNVAAPVVKYLSSGTNADLATFLYYRFAEVFASSDSTLKKNYLVFKVSPRTFLTVLQDGELEELTDLEDLNPRKWNVYRFSVNRNGVVRKFKSLTRLHATPACNITTCRLVQ